MADISLHFSSKAPLAGEAVKRHSHGGGVGVPDSSRAGRLTSYKLADFKPLTGMEEDWRFTPLKRLRGLHTEVLTGAAPAVSVTAPDSVRVETVGRDDRRIGSAAIPEDRVSANAWENFAEATVITVPSEVEVEGEVSVLLTGQVSLAQAGFFAIGAYVAGMLTVLCLPVLALGLHRPDAAEEHNARPG